MDFTDLLLTQTTVVTHGTIKFYVKNLQISACHVFKMSKGTVKILT